MPEPVTLTAAAIGAAALTEGIKFLYGQAGEILNNFDTLPLAPIAANLCLPLHGGAVNSE